MALNKQIHLSVEEIFKLAYDIGYRNGQDGIYISPIEVLKRLVHETASIEVLSKDQQKARRE